MFIYASLSMRRAFFCPRSHCVYVLLLTLAVLFSLGTDMLPQMMYLFCSNIILGEEKLLTGFGGNVLPFL